MTKSRRQRYVRLPLIQRRYLAVVLAGYALLLVNSAVLVVFGSSTASAYMSNVLLHVVIGALLVLPSLIFLGIHLAKMPFHLNRAATVVGVLTALSLTTVLATGFAMLFVGSTYRGGWLLVLHVVTAIATTVAFAGHVSLKQGVRFHFLEWKDAWQSGLRQAVRHPFGLTLAFGLAATVVTFVPWSGIGQVFVDSRTPDHGLMQSQSVLDHDRYLDPDDLGRSEACGQSGCHPDTYAQWSESVHRFSSFNNPWYARTVNLMNERSGSEATRWCASCHDPLVLFSGGFGNETPLDTTRAEAKAGLTCLACHAITGLRDLRGNGRYVIGPPDEYPFARATGGWQQAAHNKLIEIKPEPHRDAMLRPVHQTEQFCSSCHKVGIPPEVNNYRWKRGQNEWDDWHMNGASGNTVRSFYLPAAPMTCVTCHMPLVPSEDQGNTNGLIRSHRFAVANTAMPSINGHTEQLRLAQAFLSDSIATVDIFSVRVGDRVYAASEPMPALRPGDEVDVEVVVRNRKVGHRLPGGTNDSNELWLRFEALGADGTPVLVSGALDPLGRVDSTAHFWGSVLVDRESQLIDKRNVQDWNATVYAHTIGPGTAHTVHYRFTVPAGPAVTTLRAELNHRKFKWSYHHFVFRGRPVPGQADSLVSAEVDRRRWELIDAEVPELPITRMAEARREAGSPPPSHVPEWIRWNDYGIGLLLEGDTRGAIAAFARVTQVAPASPEGPINEARALLEQGHLERAAEALAEAESRRPGYLKTAYFRGLYNRALANYEETLEDWMDVYAEYPNDRVLLNGIGRVHYLAGRYAEAIDWFDRVLVIDPEDLSALYNRMLSLGAVGRQAEFEAARQVYEYHKDDEDAMAVTTPFKQAHAFDNREAQAIHEHEVHPMRRP